MQTQETSTLQVCPPGINLLEWQAQGKALAAQHNQNQWDIGDWLVAGDALYPDPSTALDAAQALFAEFSRHTLTVYKRVAKTYRPDARKYALTFTHYAIVADVQLPPTLATGKDADIKLAERRESWLAAATTHNLTCAALRFAIANPDDGGKAQPATQTATVTPEPEDRPVHAHVPNQAKVTTYNLPTLGAKYQKQLDALAKARGITPGVLAAQAVREYLDTYADAAEDALATQALEYAAAQKALADYHAQKDAEMRAANAKWAARKQAKDDFEEALKAALPGDDRDSLGGRNLIFEQAREWLLANQNADGDAIRAALMPLVPAPLLVASGRQQRDRKSTRLNSSHITISYAVFCLKKKTCDYSITLHGV